MKCNKNLKNEINSIKIQLNPMTWNGMEKNELKCNDMEWNDIKRN